MIQDKINPRIAELEAKETLTDAEMAELRSLKPGAFRKAPNAFELGITDFEKALRNLQSLSQRSKNAFEAGYYLEAISLRLHLLEFLLRIYIVNRTGVPIRYDDRKPFGQRIQDAAEAGLPQEQVDRLRAFNDTRIKGVHRLILGDIIYDNLRQAFENDPTLIEDLQDAVFSSLPTWS